MADSQKEFSELYDEYYPKIVGYVRRMVGEAEAEDVAQDAFVKINKAMERFRGESHLSTWIYRIAMNTALDHLRKPSTRHLSLHRIGTENEDGEGRAEFIMDGAPFHDTILIRKDMNDCIRGLVNDLPEKYRTVLVLAELEGLTNAESGEILGLSIDTVKMRLHRARLLLRKSMDHACHLYRDGRNELSCDRKSPTLEFRKR